MEKEIGTLRKLGVNEDSFCIGLFVDNEIPWGNEVSEKTHYAVVESVFLQEINENQGFAKKAMIQALKEKYKDISVLNEAWKADLKSFQELEEPYSGRIGKQDLSMLLTMFAEKYYKSIREIKDIYLPNIMYLGSRFAKWGISDEILQAALPYVDVISINCYKKDVNQEFMRLGKMDKPVIIGEFHITAADRNHFTQGLVPVEGQKERGQAYYNYMDSAYKNPNVIGAHWFQYYDQPALGRYFDGENSNCGFVNITDQPYKELVESAKEIHNKIYLEM